MTAITHRLRVHAFEFLLTFLWFTILPMGRLTDKLRAGDEEFSYEITIYQYYYLALVGAVKLSIAIGLALLAGLIWHPLFASVLGAATYLLLAGGIHMDGLMDTVDGMFAYGKDKWEIIKDPHVGGIGVAYLTMYTWFAIPSLAYCLYWTAQVHNPLMWFILLHVAILPRLNCYVILHKHAKSAKLDKHFTLEPKYSFWKGAALTNAWVFYALVGAFLILEVITLTQVFPWAAIYLIIAASILWFFNTKMLPGIMRNLDGLLCGDVFGLMIVLCETLLLLAYALVFVRT